MSEKRLKNRCQKYRFLFVLGSENDGKRGQKVGKNICQNWYRKRPEKHEKRGGRKHENQRRTPYCCQKTRFARFGSGAEFASKIDGKSMKKPSENRYEKREISGIRPWARSRLSNLLINKISFGRITRKKTTCMKPIWRQTKHIAQVRRNAKGGVQREKCKEKC